MISKKPLRGYKEAGAPTLATWKQTESESGFYPNTYLAISKEEGQVFRTTDNQCGLIVDVSPVDHTVPFLNNTRSKFCSHGEE